MIQQMFILLYIVVLQFNHFFTDLLQYEFGDNLSL